MNAGQKRCAKCGLYIGEHDHLSLGSGRRPLCQCPRPAARRQSTRQPTTQNITYVSSAPSVAEQLVQLAKLYSEGALTEREFQTLKNRLISGGNL
jgi:hypothetical protein